MKYCVLVLAIGDLHYKNASMEVLKHYFKKHDIPAVFLHKIPRHINPCGTHASWLKMLAHSIIPGFDYIICWDLDLLPRDPDVEVIKDFTTDKLNLAWDSHAKNKPQERTHPSFKYNGGLIGIPKEYAGFCLGIFEKYAPGKLPSYEQYYLNGEIENQKIEIHELPADLNVFPSFPEFEAARLQHYTYAKDAKEHIKDHRNRYFKSLEKPVLNELQTLLNQNLAKYIEINPLSK
jgi:hypothetical protein